MAANASNGVAKQPLQPSPLCFSNYVNELTSTHVCLITDFCVGGELFALLDKQPMQIFKEGSARHKGSEVKPKLPLFVFYKVLDIVVGDPERFRQIITNLVGNSVKKAYNENSKTDVKKLNVEDLPFSFRGLKVIVVDGKSIRAAVTRYHLTRLGIQAKVANHNKKVVSLCGKNDSLTSG
ncbi:hypothetical protein HN51_020152, partial [Arachis hypogaea]